MKVLAIVVTFHPEFNALGALLDILNSQVDTVVVVDNCSGNDFYNWFNKFYAQKVHGIFLAENTGVATAQNKGIVWARTEGADAVVLFDQDSLPEHGMVNCLAMALKNEQAKGNKVAAVGPKYVDERNVDRPSFSRLIGIRLKKVLYEQEIVPSDFIISSGSLIPICTLDEVGMMNDEFFIDQIDIEWCLRAKACGYQSYGVCSTTMQHNLGEEPLKFLGFTLLHHSPLRHYYIFRNAIRLLFKSYIPLGWKLIFIRTLLLRFFLYSLFVTPRLKYCKMMAKGVWHGLKGRMGKFIP